MEYGLRLVEQERRRGDQERAVLLGRIDSLAEELGEVRRQLCDKVRSRRRRRTRRRRRSSLCREYGRVCTTGFLVAPACGPPGKPTLYPKRADSEPLSPEELRGSVQSI